MNCKYKAAFGGWSFPQIISCLLVSFLIPLQNINHRQQHIAKLEENILHDYFLCFHISLHPIQGYKLLSYNIFLKEHFSNSIFSFENSFLKNRINYCSNFRWRGSSLVATRFLKQESRVSKPAVSELSKLKIVKGTLFF